MPKPILARLSPRAVAAALKERRISRRTEGSPDRVLLTERVLPLFAERGGRILWVGCRRYTRTYPARLEAQGGECWTLEIDPEAAAFGRKGRHLTGDLCDAARLFGDTRFDAILCNGVLGYGVDTPEAQARALEAMAHVMSPGGRLMLGWNTDKIADPDETQVAAPWFEKTPLDPLPGRLAVQNSTHVYDFYGRR